MSLKMTPKKATRTLKMTVRKEKLVTLKHPPAFTLKIPVNIVRTLMCTGYWSWNVQNAFSMITTKCVLLGLPDPQGEKLHQRGLSSVHIKTQKCWKPIFIPLLTRRTMEMTDFSFLSNHWVFNSFCHCFSIKLCLSRVWFYCELHVSINPCSVFHCFSFL